MNMYYLKVCVRIYLLISLETTILALFWRLTVLYHRFAAAVANII